MNNNSMKMYYAIKKAYVYMNSNIMGIYPADTKTSQRRPKNVLILSSKTS